jgi:hypothetical protein
VQVHALVTPGSEQMHVFSLGGESFPLEPFIPNSNQVQALALGPWETVEAAVTGGAGGGSTVGDMFYGDLRRPFTAGGMWGLQRVMSDASCPIKPLDGRTCLGVPVNTVVSALAKPQLAAGSDSGTSSLDRVTNIAAPTFVGQGAGNAQIRLYVDDALVNTGTAAANGSWTLGSTNLADGHHSVTFTQIPSGGSESAKSDPLAITIDTVGPSVFLSTGPTDPTTDPAPQFTFGPTGAGVLFECSLSTGADAFSACSTPKAYAAMPLGSYTFKLRGTDLAGNTGAVVSSSFNITAAPPVGP